MALGAVSFVKSLYEKPVVQNGEIRLIFKPYCAVEKLSKILIIDDDPLTGYLHKRLIKKFGVSHQVETVTDGDQAIQLINSCIQYKAEDKIPQLIFLEVDTLTSHGYEFLEAFKGLEFKNKDSVVVAVFTCSISQKQKNRIKEYPVKDYIIKPLKEEKIMGLMENYFGWRKV